MGLLRSGILAAALACAVLQTSARAAMVDWDTLTWAPGTLSNSYDVDPSVAGNDVTFTVGGNLGTLTVDAASNVATPAINMSLQGGQSPVEASLELAANLHTNSKVTLSVGFQNLKGVTGVTFTIFDIDTNYNKEFIKNIYGLAPDGTHVAATITLGSAVNRTGSGLNQILSGTIDVPDTGAGSDAGNAIISFGTNVITGFAFTWTNNAGAPKYQNIAISDVFFTPVPEIDPAAVAAGVCGLSIITRRLRIRRGRGSGSAATSSHKRLKF